MSFTLSDRLSPQDLDFFFHSTYQSTLDAGMTPESQSFDSFREELEGYNQTKKDYTIIVAKAENGEHAGFIWAANRGSGDELGLRQDLAWVYDLRVQPEFHRQGLARLLLAQAEDWAAHCGYTHLGLHVFGHNHAAIRLYETSGFTTFSCYLQKELPDEPSLRDLPFTLRQAATQPDIQRYKELSLDHFARLTRQQTELKEEIIAAHHTAYLERFRFNPEKHYIFLAENTAGITIGGMWFYRGKGDLGEKEYLWVQEAIASPTDLTLQMIAYLENWAAELGLNLLRTLRIGSGDDILPLLQAKGYATTNLFMHKKVITHENRIDSNL